MLTRTLEFCSQALAWQDALALGNGATGALWLATAPTDQLILCHSGAWLPGPRTDFQRGRLAELLPTIRALIQDGLPLAAERIWLERCKELGIPYVGADSCHPIASLEVAGEGHGNVSGYRRELDPATGVARTTYDDAQGGRWLREAFVSRADNLVVLRFLAPRPGALSARVSLNDLDAEHASVWMATTYPPLDKEGWKGTTVSVRDLVNIDRYTHEDGFSLRGRYRHGSGGGYAAAVRILPCGGTLRREGDTIFVHGADTVTFVAKVIADPWTPAPVETLWTDIQSVDVDVDRVKARHALLHRELYCRVQLDLGGAQDSRSVEDLLVEAGKGPVPSALWEALWAMGRHLFISSAHEEGTFPPHLQGLWTGTWRPPWFGCYTNDENVQMMHWQAVSGHLPELIRPLIRLIHRSLPHWRRNAHDLFGCRGVLAPLQQGGEWALSDQAEWHAWTGGAGWLSQHVWDAWVGTGDDRILHDHLLPLLEETAVFYRDFLREGPDGKLHAIPSVSVENQPPTWNSRWTIDATMEIAIARDVLSRLVRLHRFVGRDPKEDQGWVEMLDRLPAYRINAEGELAEWIHPAHSDHHAHRHLSHLFPVFPGQEIGWRQPELLAAAGRAVEARQQWGARSQTGWSLVHLAHIYARLGLGAKAEDCLALLLRTCVQSNLLTTHDDWRGQGLTMGGVRERGTLQLDAVYGATSAIQECLIQSASETLVLCPALFPSWIRGSVRGLGTRCGLVVDLDWDHSSGHAQAVLHAERPARVSVSWGRLRHDKDVELAAGDRCKINNQEIQKA